MNSCVFANHPVLVANEIGLEELDHLQRYQEGDRHEISEN